jgi:hypothetical protein
LDTRKAVLYQQLMMCLIQQKSSLVIIPVVAVDVLVDVEVQTQMSAGPVCAPTPSEPFTGTKREVLLSALEYSDFILWPGGPDAIHPKDVFRKRNI